MGSVVMGEVSMPAWAILGRSLRLMTACCNTVSSIARPVTVSRSTIYKYLSEVRARGHSTFKSTAAAPERPAGDRYPCPSPGIAPEQRS
jgi:hypothetical protein